MNTASKAVMGRSSGMSKRLPTVRKRSLCHCSLNRAKKPRWTGTRAGSTDNGIERKLQFFVMRLCYSKAPFVYPYEKANLESFLDGHVRAFEYFGGVPHRIAYDNLKCAVIKVGKGQHRRLTKRFRELRAWYLFETRFCNVARGNEKGDVENLCKRSERTYLSPQPSIDGIDQLASKLFDDCQNDLSRKGPEVHGGKTIGQLLKKKKSSFYHYSPSVLKPVAANRPLWTVIHWSVLIMCGIRFRFNGDIIPV